MKIEFQIDPHLQIYEYPQYNFAVKICFHFPLSDITEGDMEDLKTRCDEIMEYAKKRLKE